MSQTDIDSRSHRYYFIVVRNFCKEPASLTDLGDWETSKIVMVQEDVRKA